MKWQSDCILFRYFIKDNLEKFWAFFYSLNVSFCFLKYDQAASGRQRVDHSPCLINLAFSNHHNFSKIKSIIINSLHNVTRRALQTSNSLVAGAHIRIGEMPASVASPYQALYRFTTALLSSSCLASLARITHRRASLFLIKLLWNGGKVDKEEVGVKRSLCIGGEKYFIDPSIALCDLGGLRCQYRRQTNGPLAARCPCVM